MFLITSPSYYGRLRFHLLPFLLFLLIFVDFENKLQVICYQDVSTNSVSKLCENSSLSCSHQVAQVNVSENACQMKYHMTSDPICSNENFRGKPDSVEAFGNMNLMAYIHRSQITVKDLAFNVSFSNIHWERLVMRFIEDEIQINTLCREFLVIESAALELNLFFDCLWYNTFERGDYGGKTFSFDYKAITSGGSVAVNKYKFIVPDWNRMGNETSLRDWELFLIVDVSKIPEKIGIRIQEMPSWRGVREYNIALIRTMENNSWFVENWSLKVNSKNSDGFLRVEYKTKSKHGIYHFSARPVHPNCGEKCYETKSPIIIIVDMPEPIELICIVGSVILTPILLMAYFMWRRSWEVEVPNGEQMGPPKMLLMYNSVSVEHIRTMVEVARYLKHSCKLQTMLDQIGIPESEHKDPGKWYIESFNEAHFVGIFASPKSTSICREEAAKFSRYLNLEAIAMSQLRLRLCSPGARCKFFCIALPGTSWDTLPPEAQALKRYTLPRDLDPLLVLVGVMPQCDHGAGLQGALATAKQACLEEEGSRRKAAALVNSTTIITTTTTNINTLPTAAIALQLPRTPPASPLRVDFTPPPTPPLDSCCAESISDQDLLTSSQPYLSDTSSLDRLSLLGD